MHFSGSHALVIIAALQEAVASYASSLKQQDFYDDNVKRPGRVAFIAQFHEGDQKQKVPPGLNIEIGCNYGRWGQQPHMNTVWVNFEYEDDDIKFHTFAVSLLSAKDPKNIGNPVSVEIEYPIIEFMTDATVAAAQRLGQRVGELICQFLATGSFDPADFTKLSKR